MDTSEIAAVLQHWGEIPGEIKMVRDVYRIKTSHGVRCLKKGKKSLNRLLFMMNGIAYVQNRGFSDLARILPTRNGEMVVSYQGTFFYLQEWLEGRELDYLSLEDMSLAAEVLGRFHRASIGFRLRQGDLAKNKLGKWPQKLKARIDDLKRYINLAHEKNYPGNFDELMIKYSDWMLFHAEQSLERLNYSQYQELVDEIRDWGGLVHGDTAARNFIRIADRVRMIDFDAVALDVFVTDLWRLIRRTLSKGGWETALAEEIIFAYNKYVPVEPRHREVLGAFLQFPEIPWRIIREYYEKDNNSVVNEFLLTERLGNYLKQHRDIDLFIKNFI
jgi:CotS family spore coat protein